MKLILIDFDQTLTKLHTFHHAGLVGEACTDEELIENLKAQVFDMFQAVFNSGDMIKIVTFHHNSNLIKRYLRLAGLDDVMLDKTEIINPLSPNLSMQYQASGKNAYIALACRAAEAAFPKDPIEAIYYYDDDLNNVAQAKAFFHYQFAEYAHIPLYAHAVDRVEDYNLHITDIIARVTERSPVLSTQPIIGKNESERMNDMTPTSSTDVTPRLTPRESDVDDTVTRGRALLRQTMDTDDFEYYFNPDLLNDDSDEDTENSGNYYNQHLRDSNSDQVDVNAAATAESIINDVNKIEHATFIQTKSHQWGIGIFIMGMLMTAAAGCGCMLLSAGLMFYGAIAFLAIGAAMSTVGIGLLALHNASAQDAFLPSIKSPQLETVRSYRASDHTGSFALRSSALQAQLNEDMASRQMTTYTQS